jgi:hypothetical protein
MMRTNLLKQTTCRKAFFGTAALALLASASVSHADTSWTGGSAVDDVAYDDADNWNNGVPDSADIASMGGAGSGVTVLSGGITSTIRALNLRGGHQFTIDNSGGTFTVDGNLNMGRGVSSTSVSSIYQTDGAVSLGGLDMSGNVTGGSSFYEISGGSLIIGGFDTFDVGGDGGTGSTGGGSDLATFSIVGDTATVSVTSKIFARASSVFSFTLGASGIDAIDTTAALDINTGSVLEIDGSSYTGGAGTISLFSYSTLVDEDEFTLSISGFANLDTEVVYGASSIDLVLTSIPEPSTFALLGGLFAFAAVMVRRRV